MAEDAPMNIGAVLELPLVARQKVLRMQTKLHCWAAADRGRRFDDLFNLVADPCFLAVAWARVRENTVPVVRGSTNAPPVISRTAPPVLRVS